MRILGFGLLLLSAGCTATTPLWASADVFAPGADGHAQRWMWHSKGPAWLEDFYESVIDGAHHTVGRAEQQTELLQKGALGILAELESLRKEGARYVISAAGDSLGVRILRPDEGIAAGVGRSVLDKLGAGDERRARLIEVAIGQLGSFGARLDRFAQELEWRQYGALTDLERLRASQPLDFKLPEVAAADYERLLLTLLVALQRDLELVRGAQVGGLGVVVATRNASFDNPLSIANVEAVLLAALEDGRAGEAKRKPFFDYPPPVQKAALEEAPALAQRLLALPAYTTWKNGSHAWRQLQAFGTDVAADLKAFSALSSVFLGYDLFAVLPGGAAEIEPAVALDRLAERAPADSKLRALYTRGAALTRAAGGTLRLVESEAEAKKVHQSLSLLGGVR